MKYLPIILLISLVIMSCYPEGGRDEKIKAAIKDLSTRGLDNNMQSIDSIVIDKVTVLTQRSTLYQHITTTQQDANYLRERCASHKRSIADYLEMAATERKIGISDTLCINQAGRYAVKYSFDSTLLAGKNKSLDSLNKLHASANDVTPSGYRADYTIHFTYNHESKRSSKVALLDNSYKIADTTNPVLEYIHNEEALKKRYNQ